MRRILVLKNIEKCYTTEHKVSNYLPEPMPKYNPEIKKNKIVKIKLYSKL